MISQSHYNKLYNLISDPLEQNELAEFAALYPWDGVCYGMTMSMLMDKLGKIDFDGAFVYDCDDIWDIPAPKNGERLPKM